MALAIWPTELPQSPLMQGLEFQRLSNSLVFDTEVGESVERRRFTGRRKVIPFSLPLCTEAQRAIFFTFYEETLEDGTLFFVWKDPETGETDVTVKFVDPRPTIAPIAPDANGDMTWRISATIRRAY